MDKLQHIEVSFAEGGLLLLNIVIALIMFGVSLDLQRENFAYLVKNPKALLVALTSQLLLLPALTAGMIYLLEPSPSLALGMVMVACCPGGNVSNFFTHMAGGNIELSVSTTTFSSLLSILFTPFNFLFWGGLVMHELPSETLQLELDVLDVLQTIILIILVPIGLGFFCRKLFPEISKRIKKPIRNISFTLLLIFIVGALVKNGQLFYTHIHLVFLFVLLQNLLAFGTGYGFAALWRLPGKDRLTISIETAIQNTGLGLVLIFSYLDGNGGMALVAAWYGIWHILAGSTVAFLVQKRRKIQA